jgi:Asp-tRNA(Asn)/Glu-tRNA(Gln) amidotransferase A subunit family amidase
VCGLFGLRPTHRAVPDDGLLHLAPSFDTPGWLTMDAALLAAVGSVLLPPGSAPPPRRLLSAGPATASVRRLADAVGASLVEAPVLGGDDVTALLAAFRAVQAAEAWELHGRWITANPGALFPDVEDRFRAGASVDAEDRRHATAVIAAYRDQVTGVITPDTWLVQPAAAGPGHARDASQRDKDAWRQATLRRTVLASAFGLPSCVIPGTTRPPEGLALVAPAGADHALLEAALAAAGPGTGPGIGEPG